MALVPLLVVGAGGHGRSVAEAACLSGQFEVLGFVDDAAPADARERAAASWAGLPLLGPTHEPAAYRELAPWVVVAIGQNALREQLMARFAQAGFGWATVIHPRAWVSPSATLGAGSTLMAGAVVGTEARLGVGCIVNCGAVVDHHAQVQDYAHLGVGVSLAGASVLGRAAWLQAGCALGYGAEVPAGAVLPPGTALGGAVPPRMP